MPSLQSKEAPIFASDDGTTRDKCGAVQSIMHTVRLRARVYPLRTLLVLAAVLAFSAPFVQQSRDDVLRPRRRPASSAPRPRPLRAGAPPPPTSGARSIVACEGDPPSRPLLPPAPRNPAIHPRLHEALLQDYPRWHAEQRRCHLRHPPTRTNNSPCAPLLVWTCPPTQCAGSGDRMRGILTTYMLAAATRRVFLLDWVVPAALTAALHPASVDWTLLPDMKHLHRRGRLHVELDIPHLPWFHCFPANGRRGCMTKHSPTVKELPTDIVSSSWHYNQIGDRSLNLYRDDVRSAIQHEPMVGVELRVIPHVSYFMSNKYMRPVLVGNEDGHAVRNATDDQALFRELSHALFRPSPALERVMEERRARLGTTYDAVHARLGGDLGESTWSRFRLTNRNHSATAEALLDCLGSLRTNYTKEEEREKKVYLATDFHDFKGLFAMAARRRGVEVVLNERHAMHVKYKTEQGDELCDGFHDVLADTWLLGEGRLLVALKSGFADLSDRVGKSRAYARTEINNDGPACLLQTIDGGAESIPGRK